MRPPSDQMMERGNINMNSWIQQTCYMPVVTSGPDEQIMSMKHGTINLQMTERNGESNHKRIILYGKYESLENHKKT